ncbi:hypothetical protein EIN_019270, partial [Entamoeba invadens IP1]|uniref:hypothetical protein n=1 Tax=Entamoeba invadens IP1 TaxID=370355 RepID=UPI0002C3DD92
MYHPSYSMFLDDVKEHPVGNLSSKNTQLVHGHFMKPNLDRIEVLIIVTETHLALVDVTIGDTFIVSPPLLHHIDNINLSCGCFAKESNTFYLVMYSINGNKKDYNSVYKFSITFKDQGLYATLQSRVQFTKHLVQIFPFDYDLLVGFEDSTFVMMSDTTKYFAIKNRQTRKNEEINVETLQITKDESRMMYIRSDNVLVVSGLVPGSSMPIIQATNVINMEVDWYDVGVGIYFAVVDKEGKIVVFQFSQANYECHRVRNIQKNVFEEEKSNFLPSVSFLPNGNIVAQIKEESVILSTDGIMMNRIKKTGKFISDSNGCRLWKAQWTGEDYLRVEEIRVVNIYESEEIGVEYSSTFITAIPSNLHHNKKLATCHIPSSVLRKCFFEIQYLQVYEMNGEFLVLLQQTHVLWVFNFDASILASIPIDPCCLNSCVQWCFIKNFLVIFQFFPTLVNISIFKYPNFNVQIFSTTEPIPPLTQIPQSKKFTFFTDQISPTYYVHPKENTFKFDITTPINAGDTDVFSSLDTMLALYLELPQQNNVFYPTSEIPNLYGVCLLSKNDDLISTFLHYKNRMGLIVWKVNLLNNMASITQVKCVEGIRGDTCDLRSSVPLKFVSIFGDDKKSPLSTIVLWSNFVISLTRYNKNVPTEIIGDNAHSFVLPFFNILLIEQSNTVTMRHLDSLFYTFNIPIKKPLMLSNLPHLTIITAVEEPPLFETQISAKPQPIRPSGVESDLNVSLNSSQNISQYNSLTQSPGISPLTPVTPKTPMSFSPIANTFVPLKTPNLLSDNEFISSLILSPRKGQKVQQKDER